ncbi:MAG: DUF563 domain-containing protein [Drouetiella hepatica Uher 2000/2452]|jgi:tetratricopeptide (TPR) repeat protein|uniref:DUF563 domain-containing protein n=1 Tax=Drouetiella hepatica Uher 2000/2452 TaxID=904376 RepID=A0A951UPK3_9CYAN|nr:DUF563 domain-containing protein [Drouetiella hepatica Uher 2000/2452]
MSNRSLSSQNSLALADPIAHYSHQIEAYPEVLSNYWHLGLAWLVLGDAIEAQTIWFSTITAIAPGDMEAGMTELLDILAIAAKEYLQLGKFFTAEQIYLQMLEIDATAEPVLNLGSAVSQQGRYEEAIAHWQTAIDLPLNPLQPYLAETYRRQAEVWQKLGQWQEAIAAYTQAIHWHPTGQSTGQVHSAIGWCLGQQEDWQTAEAQFRQALTLDPENSGFYGDLGWALLQQKKWGEAIASFQQAVWLKSRFAQTYCYWVDSLEQPNMTRVFNARFLALLNPDLLNPESRSVELSQALENLLRANLHEDQNGTIAESFSSLTSPIVSAEAVSATQPPLPSRFHQTTCGWIAGSDHPGSNHSDSSKYISLDQPHQVSLTPPQTLDDEIHFSFRFGEAIVLPETFVAEIPQGRFWLSVDQTSSAVIASDGVLGDLSAEFPLLSPNHPDRYSGHSALALPYLPPVQKISGTVAVLSGLANDLYFHWMLDVLPRWALLQRSGIDLDEIDGFVVSDRLSFQAETLAILGIPAKKIVTGQHIQADRLVVPSYPGSPAWMPPWVCPWLQRLLSINAGHRPSSQTRSRLYISRSQATHRRLINESEVMNLLEPLGFQSVTLESLSVRAQAELLANAEVVISPHGGGLTNLVFCQSGTQVIELFAPHYVYPCYWFISNLGGLRYAYLVGKTPAGGLHRLLYADVRTEDIWIDLEELRSLLHALLLSS